MTFRATSAPKTERRSRLDSYWMSIINRMRIKHNVILLILSCFLIKSTNQSINLHSGILKHDRINGIISLEFFFLLPQLKVSQC